MRSVFAAALVAVIIGTCEAQCSSAAVLDASCCPMIETCQATPEQGCTSLTSTVTLNGARTYYEANGWGLFKDSSTDTWKYQQCSSGLTGSLAVTSSVTCPTDLPRNAWTFSGSWGSSLPASGTYFTFRCMNQPPSPPPVNTSSSTRAQTGAWRKPAPTTTFALVGPEPSKHLTRQTSNPNLLSCSRWPRCSSKSRCQRLQSK